MWLRESVTPSLMTMTESATAYADGPTQERLRRTRPGSYSRSATETTEEPFTGCTVTSRADSSPVSHAEALRWGDSSSTQSSYAASANGGGVSPIRFE